MGAHVVVVAIGAGIAIVVFIIGVSIVICVIFIIIVLVSETCVVICIMQPQLCVGEGKGNWVGGYIGCVAFVAFGAMSWLSALSVNGESIMVMIISLFWPLSLWRGRKNERLIVRLSLLSTCTKSAGFHGMQVGVLGIGARDCCRLSLLPFVSRRSERACCYQFV